MPGEILEVLLDEFAEAFVVFFFHVDELDAAAVGADVADDGGEVDFAEAGADFELEGIADAEAVGRFYVGAAEADSFHAHRAHHLGLAADLRAQRRFERDARIAARNDEIAERRGRRFERSTDASGGRSFFHHRERVFGGETEACRFDVSEALALASELAKHFDGFGGAEAAESLNGFDADENVAKNFVFAGGDFHEQGNGGGFLADADLIDHHRNDEWMGFGEDCREDKGGALRRRSVGGASEFADSEILKIPFPTGHRAGETAEEAIGIGGGEQFDGGADTLAAGFEEPGLEKRENGDADGAEQTGHGGNRFGAARVSEQEG